MEIEILTKNELDLFNSPPTLDYQEQIYFFNMDETLLEELISRYKKENIAYFILLYGYFKKSNKFYDINDKENEVLEYIFQEYSLEQLELNISSRTVRAYKKRIKEYFKINEYDDKMRETLLEEAIYLSNSFIHRKKIFYTLVEFSKKLKIEVPSYTELSKIIAIAVNNQKREIIKKLTPFINDDSLTNLNAFLEKDENYKNRWYLTHYKKLEHSTNRGDIRVSLKKFQTIKVKFEATKNIINSIGLTPKIAQYHAIWIAKGQVFQVRRKKDVESIFLLLSFTYYQYFIRNDNLMDRFISIVQTAKNSSLRSQKEESFKQEPNKNRMIQALEESNLSIINEIAFIIKDEKMSSSKKISLIDGLLKQKSSLLTEILSEKKVFESSVEKKYEFIEEQSQALQGKLSGIVKIMEFDKVNSHKNIIEAINYFKENNGLIQKGSPVAFMNDEEQSIIFTEGKIRVSLYKVLLFFHIADSIKSGRLNLKYSYRYQNFENYLIDKKEWTESKDKLLETYALTHLKEFDKFLTPIKSKLEDNFESTNKRIIKELNTNLKLTADSFILKTPKLENKVSQKQSISQYFPKDDYLSVIDVLHSINQETNFLEAFSHYTKSKKERSKNLLLASILGYGCNINISKIGKISKGINENQLDNTKIWYFSEDNTIEANNKVLAFMNQLEIVKLLRNNKGINHTSSDGQKFNISSSIESVNAGYSFKYFGTAKGVSVYTFIDESHQLFHSQVINVSERESGYVIDGLMHNDVIKSDIHSTDTHGYSEVIFGLTHFLGFSFAPRIRNFKKQQLYSFKPPKEYHSLGYKLLPKHRIKEQIIKDNWDDILRLIITIKSRKTTTSQLLKRLTSYSRQHKLYRAVKEFGKIIKTDFLLTYIDNVELRQRIEKQLNKVESSNKFSKAVFFGNNAEFQASTVEEQNIANNSKRLIQNSIILWNYLYMSKKIQEAHSEKEKDEIIKSIKNSSIIHWSHINFYGEYDFTKRDKRVNSMISLDEDSIF